MKAARLVERRKPLELTDLPDPAPAAGEVVIEEAEQGYVPVPLDHIIESEIEIAGSVGNPHVDYPRLLGLVETGVLRPARIVGQTLALEQASDVLDSMDSYETLGFSVITEF